MTLPPVPSSRSVSHRVGFLAFFLTFAAVLITGTVFRYGLSVFSVACSLIPIVGTVVILLFQSGRILSVVLGILFGGLALMFAPVPAYGSLMAYEFFASGSVFPEAPVERSISRDFVVEIAEIERRTDRSLRVRAWVVSVDGNALPEDLGAIVFFQPNIRVSV
ncbi:MAG TPA: hypothetical protein PK765_00345 [bacterium]|nr:hypothetical protein [bacterium]